MAVLLAGAGLTWSWYRDSRVQSDRITAIGFGLALLFQLGPVLVALSSRGEVSWISGALETLVAGALVWGLVFPLLKRPPIVQYAPAGLGVAVGVAALFWPDHSLPLWGISSGLIFALGATVVVLRRNVHQWICLSIALFLLGAAPLVQVIGSATPLFSERADLAAVGSGRLIALGGYLLLIATLYLKLAAGWQYERNSLDSELKSLSLGSLQQTQERLFMLQVSQTVSSSLELRRVLDAAAESLALGGHADRVAIALTEESDSEHLWIAANYAILARNATPQDLIHFRLDNFPRIRRAVEKQASILFQDGLGGEKPDSEVVTFHTLLKSPQVGPLMVQPLIHQDSLVGLILLSNSDSLRLFSEEDERFCVTLSGQITTAIANAQLYHRVSRLLREQVADASQRNAILQSIADGVIATDLIGRIIVVNPAAATILQLEPADAIGRSLDAVCPMLWLDGKPRDNSFELHNKVIRGAVTQVLRPSGEALGYVAVLRDVTQEIQSERAKSQFIATVSHELRTPMTAIKGYADLMTVGVGGELSTEQRQYVDIILANTERMVGIVNNMIAVSELEGETDISPESMDIAPLLQQVSRDIEGEVQRRNLSFRLQAPAHIPRILGDPLRLRQVMYNLLSNACKFTRSGGRIGITVRELPAGTVDPYDTGFLVIAVSDTGVGIPLEERPRIFERFYRADNPLSIEAGGTGVGLTIAKDLIERQGGRMWVDSAVGRGSTFTFLIPLAN